MEQVDKDINVRSKDEPQNYCDDCLYTDTCDSKAFFYACTSKATISKMEQVDKPQTDCNGCKFVGTYDTEFPCANCRRKTKDYYAKDEPQRDCESCKYFGHDEIEACGYCRHKDLYEPQTERSE